MPDSRASKAYIITGHELVLPLVPYKFLLAILSFVTPRAQRCCALWKVGSLVWVGSTHSACKGFKSHHPISKSGHHSVVNMTSNNHDEKLEPGISLRLPDDFGLTQNVCLHECDFKRQISIITRGMSHSLIWSHWSERQLKASKPLARFRHRDIRPHGSLLNSAESSWSLSSQSYSGPYCW